MRHSISKKDKLDNNLIELELVVKKLGKLLDSKLVVEPFVDDMITLTDNKIKEFERLAELIKIVLDK